MKMIKTIIIIICAIAISACDSGHKKTDKKIFNYPFSCLTTQNHCVVETEVGRFTINFSGMTEQGMVKTELPFQVRLTLDPIDKSHNLKTVQSFLEGKNMFMGKIPVFFKQGEVTNQLIAETLLASCSEEVMTWRLWVEAEIAIGDELKQHSFFIDFDSKRL